MRRRRFLAAAAGGTAGLAGCSAIPGLSNPELDPAAISTKTHERVNERRREEGLAELGYDEDLETVARSHSEDMAERGYYAHVDPEGDNWDDRYEQHGYDCRVRVDDTHTATSGENLFRISYSNKSFTDEDIAEKTVTGWMNSPEHRENMLEEYWTVEGIGVHVVESDDETTVFVTQNFC